jgi:biofilm PGA synthesis N-glycosyltransferase PgaC
VIIINDGSTDDTLRIAKRLAIRSKRVRTLSQKNAGKSAALNFGLRRAKGEVIVCVDADTVFPSYTVSRLIRHFIDPSVGAVAGSVKVGNITNLLARWQALEYTVSIFLERAAQACLDAIVIVPGACGAWRKEAIVMAGGYSSDTLAEDCDLTLAVRRAGYRIIQDNGAEGYTEVPSDIKTLAKQRFRWIFGNMQSFWKHRYMTFNRQYGWLGMAIIPYSIFNIVMPILFVPLMTGLAIVNIVNEQYLIMIAYFCAILTVQFLSGLLAVILARERYSLLTAVPVARIVYSPIKSYLMYKSVVTILRGSTVKWNKFQRTGTVALSDIFRRRHRLAH